MDELFNPQSSSVQSSRILYTPSTFARTSLLHLQEVGSLQAIHPHTSTRTDLVSFLFFVGNRQTTPRQKQQRKQAHVAMSPFRNVGSHLSAEKIFNDIHELSRFEPAEGATDCQLHNGPAICGYVWNKQTWLLAGAQIPYTYPK